MTPSGKYYASVLLEKEGIVTVSNQYENIIGIDLGIKDFAIAHDGNKTSKYGNSRHLAKHAKNLKRKQQKLARKQQLLKTS